MGMDDLLLDELGRSLVSLERLAPLVDDLLVPRQASSGENAGKAPAKKGSKLPLSASIVDMKIDAQQVLGGWCGCLTDDAPEVGQAPVDRSLGARASWLREQLAVLEMMPWAELCAEEIIAQARLIADVVDPLPSVSDPEPIEWGTAREVVSWARLLGVPVSRSSVQRWVLSGEVASEMCPDGRVLVLLADVLERGRRAGKTSKDSRMGHPA